MQTRTQLKEQQSSDETDGASPATTNASAMLPEHIIFERASKITHAKELNLPRSEEFVVNDRGQTLHVRSFWPDKPAKAIAVYLHGYSAHINRPAQDYTSTMLNSHGYGYVTIDYHGHGYSDGDRAYIESYEHLMDDVLALLFALFCNDQKESPFHFLKNNSCGLPLFLIGHSMGGGLALLMGNLLTKYISHDAHTAFSSANYDKVATVAQHFKGCILLAPLVNIKRPPQFVCHLMDYVVTPLLGPYPLPDFLCGATNYAHSVSSEHYHKYITLDKHHPEKNPEGLMWNGNVRFSTATACLALSDRVQAIIPTVEFPFVIFHDPNDEITTCEGSRLLFDNSPDHIMKDFVEVKDGLHDLLTNKLSWIVNEMIGWMERHEL